MDLQIDTIIITKPGQDLNPGHLSFCTTDQMLYLEDRYLEYHEYVKVIQKSHVHIPLKVHVF
jgi:hypothetical protein